MDLYKKLIENLKQSMALLRKVNLSLFLVFLAYSTTLWPFPSPLQRIFRWSLLYASFLIWDFSKMVKNGYKLSLNVRNAIVIITIIFYTISIVFSQLSSFVMVLYLCILGVNTYLWVTPVSPMILKIKDKTIKIGDWFILVLTGLFIVSFEFLTFPFPK
jgi:hypothetical protein